MANAGAWVIQSILDETFVKKDVFGYIYEEIISIERTRSDVTQGTFHIIPEAFSLHLDVMLKDGIPILQYNLFLRRNGFMLKDYTIYQPSLFCADDQEMQNELEKPKEHYDMKKPIYMHTVLAEY
eukprot:10919796-Ditylum_brightwellii.AAC.1